VTVCEVVCLLLETRKKTDKRRVILGVGGLAKARHSTPSLSCLTCSCSCSCFSSSSLVGLPLFRHERRSGQGPPSRHQGRCPLSTASRCLLLLLRLGLLLLLLLLLLPLGKGSIGHAAAVGHGDGEDAAGVHGMQYGCGVCTVLRVKPGGGGDRKDVV